MILKTYTEDLMELKRRLRLENNRIEKARIEA